MILIDFDTSRPTIRRSLDIPKIADFPVGFKLFDLHEGGHIGDSGNCFLDRTDLTYDGVLILCLLNKPAIEYLG